MATKVTQNILTLIERDHRKVEELFEEIEKNESSKKLQKLFDQIYLELTLHADAEKEVLYSVMKEHKKTKGFVKEAKAEHKEVENILKKMKKLDSEDAKFQTKLQELITAVKHHVAEEEGEIFQAIRECMNEPELQELAKEFQEKKASLKPDLKVSTK